MDKELNNRVLLVRPDDKEQIGRLDREVQQLLGKLGVPYFLLCVGDLDLARERLEAEPWDLVLSYASPEDRLNGHDFTRWFLHAENRPPTVVLAPERVVPSVRAELKQIGLRNISVLEKSELDASRLKDMLFSLSSR